MHCSVFTELFRSQGAWRSTKVHRRRCPLVKSNLYVAQHLGPLVNIQPLYVASNNLTQGCRCPPSCSLHYLRNFVQRSQKKTSHTASELGSGAQGRIQRVWQRCSLGLVCLCCRPRATAVCWEGSGGKLKQRRPPRDRHPPANPSTPRFFLLHVCALVF